MWPPTAIENNFSTMPLTLGATVVAIELELALRQALYPD